MSGSSSPEQDLALAQARLAALQAARSGLVGGLGDGVQQVRYPDGSGVTYGSVPDRLAGVAPLDREIAQVEALILRLRGTRPRRPIRQVRILASKGL